MNPQVNRKSTVRQGTAHAVAESGAASERRRRVRRRGFTAIELLTVLGLMSVVMAIMAPRVAQPRRKASVHAASSQLISLLESARAAAVRRGQSASFHLSSTQVWVTVDQDGSPVTLVAPTYLDPALNVQMASGAPEIAFNPRGFVSNLGGQVSVIVSRDMESDTLCVTRGGAIVRRGCGT